MDNNRLYVSSFTIHTDINTLCEIENKQKAELVQQAANKIGYRQWVAIKLDATTRSPEPWEDPLKPTEIISTLELKPIKEEHVEVRVMEPRFCHKEYKGFWKKLKLAFSKKVAYTEE